MWQRYQRNPLQFPYLTDFWCAYELSDRSRTMALLIDDMQVEYKEYVQGIVAPIQELLVEFRKAKLPIFWSTWWRWGPEDGFFNSMDRFYGPIGWNTSLNAFPKRGLEKHQFHRMAVALSEAKEQPSKDKLLQSAELIEQAKEALRHLRQKASSQAEAAEP
eukprot:g32460.t1